MRGKTRCWLGWGDRDVSSSFLIDAERDPQRQARGVRLNIAASTIWELSCLVEFITYKLGTWVFHKMHGEVRHLKMGSPKALCWVGRFLRWTLIKAEEKAGSWIPDLSGNEMPMPKLYSYMLKHFLSKTRQRLSLHNVQGWRSDLSFYVIAH